MNKLLEMKKVLKYSKELKFMFGKQKAYRKKQVVARLKSSIASENILLFR